jgi:plastocyanin
MGVIMLSATLALGVIAAVAATAPSGAVNRTKPDTIVISNFMFHPMILKVSPGATITVTNKDSVVHTLTATGGQFNTGRIAHDKSKKFKAPKKRGRYDYICSIHQFMTGVIVVK